MNRTITVAATQMPCDWNIAGNIERAVLTHAFDLDACARHRERWCLFRDRRPDHYGPIMTLDGQVQV